jgi:hypothetical protein
MYLVSTRTLKTHRLRINFLGEGGIDTGGLSKEWFSELGKTIMEKGSKLFEITNTREEFRMISRTCVYPNDYRLEHFRFVGKLMGLAIMEGKCLGFSLPSIIYRFILYRQCTIETLKSFDSTYYTRLFGLRDDCEGLESLSLFLNCDVKVAEGETITVPLREGGESIAVGEDNLHEYIRKKTYFEIVGGREKQMEELRSGFYEIVDSSLIGIFNEQELKELVEGLTAINVDDWERHSIFKGFTSEEKERYKEWFWKAVISFSDEQRAKLLQFITGSSRVPIDGIARLFRCNKDRLFIIERSRDGRGSLPTSRTCLGMIYLPCYKSFEELSRKLVLAIEGCNTFGFR